MRSGLISQQRVGRGGVALGVASLHLALFALLANSVDHSAFLALTGDGGGAITTGLISASAVGLRSAQTPSPQGSALDALNDRLSSSDPQAAPGSSPAAPDSASLLQQMAAPLTQPRVSSSSIAQSSSRPPTATQTMAGPAGGNPWAHASVRSSSYREGQILAKIQPCWAGVRARLPLQIRLTVNAQGGLETIVPISSVAPGDPIIDQAIKAIRACGPYPTSGSDSAAYSLLLPAIG